MRRSAHLLRRPPPPEPPPSRTVPGCRGPLLWSAALGQHGEGGRTVIESKSRGTVRIATGGRATNGSTPELGGGVACVARRADRARGPLALVLTRRWASSSQTASTSALSRPSRRSPRPLVASSTRPWVRRAPTIPAYTVRRHQRPRSFAAGSHAGLGCDVEGHAPGARHTGASQEVDLGPGPSHRPGSTLLGAHRAPALHCSTPWSRPALQRRTRRWRSGIVERQCRRQTGLLDEAVALARSDGRERTARSSPCTKSSSSAKPPAFCGA